MFMNEKNLIDYYNKFNEDKRLNTRHGQVEYITSMKYIHDMLKNFKNPKILDIGAGCGRYSITLADEGYDVTAVELVKHNLRVIEKKSNKVKAILGNAVNLKKLEDNSFDLVLLFGPMYHLCNKEDQLKALLEAKRVVKENGIILVAYCMNEYCVITHGLKDNHLLECLENNMLDENFHCISKETDLYNVVRLEDINELNEKANLKRIKIITPDGPSNYLRPVLNKMDNETFEAYLKYHFSTCERMDLIGAAVHTVDILINEKH